MNNLPSLGDVLLHGSATHDGVPNVVRVVRESAISSGFYAVFVSPHDTRELRMPCDRPFFVWDFMMTNMRPYEGLPELVEHPTNQITIF